VDLSNARTESMVVFREFRIAFDQSLKVASAALRFLEKNAAGPGGAKLVDDLIREAKEPGGSVGIGAPRHVIETSLIHLSGLWIAQVLSAFEVFLLGTRSELQSFVKPRPSLTGSTTDADGKVSVTKLYEQMGWDSAALTPYLSLLDYFQLCRNCVVHRSGAASAALVSFPMDPNDYFRNWPDYARRRGLRLPPLPLLVERRPIAFRPRHSILASVVCNRIAEEVNKQSISSLGKEGIIHIGAGRAFQSDEPYPFLLSYLLRAKGAHEAILSVLWERYHVRQLSSGVIARVLVASGPKFPRNICGSWKMLAP